MNHYELAISFGGELVNLVSKSLKGLNYFPNGYIYNPTRKPRFDTSQTVVDAVGNLMILGRNDIFKCYHEVRAIVDGDPKIFAQLAMQGAVAYFPSGYTHPAFLSYCAMVIGVATMFCENDKSPLNREPILDGAAGVIGTVLFGQILSSGVSGPSEWTDEMIKIAEEFNEFAAPLVRELKLKMAKSNRDE